MKRIDLYNFQIYISRWLCQIQKGKGKRKIQAGQGNWSKEDSEKHDREGEKISKKILATK